MRPFMNDDSGLCKCPLMGASTAVSMIDGAYTLVIGTEECAHYTKTTQAMKFGGDTCFSVVLNNQDVTFGSSEKVSTAVEELMAEYKPKRLFLITTCVVEIIGDDFAALAKRTQETYGIPVHVIQTSHFKGQNEEDGMEQVRAVMGKQMPSKFQMMMQKMKSGKGMSREEKMKMMESRGQMPHRGDRRARP